MDTKALPIGIDNFEKIRNGGFYYVDKTRLIAELVRERAEVTLFTRPRRFGKSLNMSMLKSFFEIGCDKSLFDGLAIAQEKELCEQYMGQFPVISISLKGVDGSSFESAYEMLCSIIQEEAQRLQFLLDSDALTDAEKQQLKVMTLPEQKPVVIKTSLKVLSRLLRKHYGQKVIILIDEYDVPLDKAYANGYYREMLEIIRSMLDGALKGNESLFFAVMTGCMRVSKESIFTGLNNLKICSVSDVEYDEYFGFTDDEVRKLLSDYGFESHYDEVREWYDGYLFGKQSVYCPWDVISYCDTLCANPTAKPKAYWLNTSGNDMVHRLIDRTANVTTRKEVENLIAGQTVVKSLNEQITHSEIDISIDNIWSLLYMTGYLTVTECPDEKYILRIPNREIRQIFEKQVLTWFSDKVKAESGMLSGLYAAFESGDVETISSMLSKQLISTVSFYDEKESFYHGFLLALLSACEHWSVSSNDEAGNGRADIIVESADGKFSFVIELKYEKDAAKLDIACETAMNQIEEKDYTAILRESGVEQIREYGIAFGKKKCKVVTKQVAF